MNRGKRGYTFIAPFSMLTSYIGDAHSLGNVKGRVAWGKMSITGQAVDIVDL